MVSNVAPHKHNVLPSLSKMGNIQTRAVPLGTRLVFFFSYKKAFSLHSLTLCLTAKFHTASHLTVFTSHTYWSKS